MSIPTAAEIEAIRQRDAVNHHPDHVADSGKIHVFGDYLYLATDSIRDRHALLAALDAVTAAYESLRRCATCDRTGGVGCFGYSCEECTLEMVSQLAAVTAERDRYKQLAAAFIAME